MKKLVLAAATICALVSSVSMAGGLLAAHPLAKVAVVQQLAVLPVLNTASRLGAMPAFSSAGLGALPGLERNSLAASPAAGNFAWLTYDRTVFVSKLKYWANVHAASEVLRVTNIVAATASTGEGGPVSNPGGYASFVASMAIGGADEIILPSTGGTIPVPRPKFPGDIQMPDLPLGLLFGTSQQ